MKIRTLAIAAGLGATTLCSVLMFLIICVLDLLIGVYLPHAVLLGLYVVVGVVSYIMLTWLLNRALLYTFLHTTGVRKQPAAQ